MPRRTIPAALLAVAASAALAGCGADVSGGGGAPGPTPEQQVRAVVARFGIAARDRDYRTICDQLLADDLLQKMQAVGLPCEATLQRALGGVRDPTLVIEQVTVDGGQAVARVHTTAAGQPPSDDALQLVRQGDEWRIASLAQPGGTGASTSAPPSTTTPPSATTGTTGTTRTTGTTGTTGGD